MPHFKWNREKAKSNLRKHGINFDEATSIFLDDFSLTLFDEFHSTEEDRFMDIGRSSNGNILVVVYTERGSDIRIISCRKAMSDERRSYEKQNT